MLKRLCDMPGISGDEGGVRRLLMAELIPFADLHVDRMGNLIATVAGDVGSPTLLLAAHMDEVGFIVTAIDDNGFLRVKPVGGINPQVLPGKFVRVGDKALPGVIGIKAIHLLEEDEIKKTPDIDSLTVDIGAASRQQAARYVMPGDSVWFDTSYNNLGALIRSKALDDRVGCAVLAELAKVRRRPTVHYAFTVQEEVGARGAAVVAHALHPYAAVVVDCTAAADVPGVKPEEQVARLGKGPVIPVFDGTGPAHPGVRRALIAGAERAGVPWQNKEGIAGGTDARSIRVSRSGIPTATASAPGRYLHSPAVVVAQSDIDALAATLAAYLEGEKYV